MGLNRTFRHRARARLALAVTGLLAMSAAFAWAQAGGRLEVVWRAKKKFTFAPPPAAADLNLDQNLEVILVDTTNHVSAIDPSRKRGVWDVQVRLEEKLFTPVSGHFVGDGTIDVLLVGSEGSMLLLDGLSGKVQARHKLDFKPVGPASTFPLADSDPAKPQFREGAAVVSAEGRLVGFDFVLGKTPITVFSFELQDLIKESPAVGMTAWSAPGPHLVSVSRIGSINLISGARDSTQSIKAPIDRIRSAEVWSAMGDVDGDGLDDVVVADDGGYVYALTVKNDHLVPIWERVSIESKPAQTPIVIDVNGDKHGDILVAKGDSQYLLVDGATGKRSIWDAPAYIHDSLIQAPLTPFRGADGRAYAVISDSLSRIGILDIWGRGIKEDDAGPMRIDVTSFTQTSGLVGPFFENGRPGIFALGWRDGTGYLLEPGMDLDPASPPWLGHLGGPRHTSSLSPSYQIYLKQQHETLANRVHENIAEAKTHFQSGDWAEARQSAEQALAAAPDNEEARKVHRSAWIHEKLLAISVGVILAVIAAGIGAWQFLIVARRALMLRKMQRTLAQGDKKQGVDLLFKIQKSSPGNLSYLRSLADLYLELEQYDGRSAEIFEKARAAFPHDERYVTGLAMSYEAELRRDEVASAVYREMMKRSNQPGKWAFSLGESHLELGKPEDALRYFKRSVDSGHDDPKLPEHLADLYARLGIVQAEALPIMTRFVDRRMKDAAYLKTYLKVCEKAHAYGEIAREAAEALLLIEPTASEAHMALASMMLTDGSIKESMKHAEAVLQTSPNDSCGLRLLGACYAAENRLDQTAMKIFRRALDSNPEAPEILQAVSKGYMQEGREDDEAREIYIRAIDGVPNDETILQFVADMASKQADDDLTIQTCERLLKLGRHNRKLILQLADAYCRKGVIDDASEQIYREALLFQPDHSTVQTNLANIYVRNNRVDAEAMSLYETVYQRDSKKHDIGRSLARAYAEAELPDRTLALAQKLLTEDPNDDEIQKLQAHAAFALDHMDSAITTYEQLLERNPDDEDTVTRLASLYGKKRLSDVQAMNVYQKAARIKNDSFEIHAALARGWVAQKNWDQAVATMKHLLSHAPHMISMCIGLMEELIEPHPNATKLHWFLVDTLIYDGRLREASKLLIDMMKIEPEQSEKALGHFEKILTKNPRDAVSLQQRGLILMGVNRLSEARQALELAYRCSPADEAIARDLMDLYQKTLEKNDQAELRFQLGKMAMATGKHELAISCFQRTAKDYRWESSSIKALARCFMAKGMLDLAVSELKRLNMDNEVKEILYELGQRYESVNDNKGAREVYRTIFAVDIGYQDVKGKLEMLESMQAETLSAERTSIINTLSEQAKARYELVEELGRGAMGIVYKAKDNELEEIVALKILPDTLGNNNDAVRRFRTEARNARHLSHPNIVRIHDIGEEMGRKYISMEYVNGINLKQRMIQADRKLPFAEVLNYCKQICAAMSAAHDAGIVHRDIKPANIMITQDGKIKVADFGIAKAIQDEHVPPVGLETQSNQIIGTPLYMAPEQIQGGATDYRSDIYSLGIMFYEMANGQPPFTKGDIIYQHLIDEPKPLEGINETLAHIIMKCIAKKPEARWQNVREILDELKNIEVMV